MGKNEGVTLIFPLKNEIKICNEAGRPTRPVLKVKNNKPLLTKETVERLRKKEIAWEDLFINHKIEESVLEYIDPDEQNVSMIAMSSNKIIKGSNGSFKILIPDWLDI